MSLISKSKNFKLSAWQDNQIQLFIVQGEGGIKTAQFTLTDDNGVLDLTAVSSVTYNATKHNGTACCIDCSIVDAKAGAIELKIETGITDVVGNVNGEIEVINENGSIKFHGITICVKGGTVEDLIQASSEFSALVKALNKVALLTPEGTITLDDELTDEGINPAPSGVVKQYVDNEVDKKLNDKNGVIKTAHLGEEAVTSDKLSSGAVTTDKIEFGAVGEDELNSELVEKINSKANADLCIKQSSTQLIKLTDIDTSINGLHIIIKNNHISIKGTAEKGVYSSIAIATGINQFEANTSYTASIQNLEDNTAETDYIGLYCSGVGVPITEADEHKVLNFTTDTQVSLNWNIQTGEYDKEFDFQIELGSEVTSFEPYYVVSNIANGSVSKEKLSEDVQDSLNVMNVELPKKAESSDLLNKSSFFEFEDITSTVGVETGYYYGAFNHNSVANFECTANPISCKSGDIFKITSATVNMDGHQAIVKCYDKNQVLISSHFEASGTDILTVTDKLFIVPENVEYAAFNCWKHDNNLYNLKVEKAKPYTNNYGLLVNTLVSSLPSNELLGKSIYSDGDSIAQGTGTANRSYAYLLADKYNMTLTSRAVGGTTIAVHPDNGDNKSIYERITENITSDSQYDYIILDGGTNDVTKSIPLGTITDGVDSEFDTSTVLGALEATCKHLNTVQLTAKKLFVFVTNRVEMLKTTKDTFSKMKQVLNKWGIPYIDLSTINSLGRWNDTVAEDYFADEIHPNLEAHKEFYLPYIEKALLYGSYANDSSDSNASISLSSDEKNEIIAQVIATLPDDVIGISDAEINNDGELVITYTDKSSKGLGVVVGQDGKDGVSCTHVWSGDTLIVTSASGTSSRNLKGEKGDKGDTGEQGIQGLNGADGKDGRSITSVDINTSNTDGGTNTATFNFSDGNSSTVPISKNGATGADGKDYVLTDEDKTEIANQAKNLIPMSDYILKNQGSTNVGKILMVGTDGNLILANMPPGSGDVIGTIDDNNNILLSGNLSDGTYILKYENADGTVSEVGTIEVGNISEPIQPVTNDIVVTKNMRISLSSDGGDSAENGCCATEWIDLTNIPKPCTINLTGIKWSSASSATDYHTRVMSVYKDSSDTVIDKGYTSPDVTVATVTNNNDDGTDVTVTITNTNIAKIRFCGASSTASPAGVGSIDDARATLTYTPNE